MTIDSGDPPPSDDVPLDALADPVEVRRGYERLRGSSLVWEKRIPLAAALVLAIFDGFYEALCAYPYRAQRAFETIDPQASLAVSRERLTLYSRFVEAHGPRIAAAFPELAEDAHLWDAVDTAFAPLIENRYEADIAYAFAHSLRRNVCAGVWRPVAYAFPAPSEKRALSLANAHRRLPVEDGVIGVRLVAEALRLSRLRVPFADVEGDAERIAERARRALADEHAGFAPVALEVIEAGFFRDVTAFVVGRWVLDGGAHVPFVVALSNGPRGIVADALLHRTADVHNLFSSTLANFHVTSRLYYQVCVFLFSLMPRRPLGLHYSTIGFNHVGKVAVVDEIRRELARSGQVFERSPGAAGTVAMGFTFEASGYHLKVIRDRPTRAYKWGAFAGVDAVLDKYRIVHEINRTGSMLDNVLYFNLELERSMFSPALLDELCAEAGASVQVEGDRVLFHTLIVQLKIVPIPVFLAGADEDAARSVMENLGHCIRNNMAAGIFNKDLDARNYGVGRYRKVFLFDYDAVERLADVKIRTNLDREAGEEDVPGWFFEEGVVFLPEELESGLRIDDRVARRHFRELNADLLAVGPWREAQERLARGEVLPLRLYPENRRLDAAYDPAAD